MSFQTTEQEVEIAGDTWRLKTLTDRQQFHDPDGSAEAAGVSPAMWSLFGVTWSAGLLLAETMAREPIAGKRILEVGCGLGLASMVVARRGGDILASDLHPLAGEFLEHNAGMNDITVPFRCIDWREPAGDIGKFDLIIGSDLLYERGQPEALAPFVLSHAAKHSEIILADPGRKQVSAFTRLVVAAGFHSDERSFGKARLVRYSR